MAIRNSEFNFFTFTFSGLWALLGPTWRSNGPQSHRHDTNSICSHMSCSHIHRSPKVLARPPSTPPPLALQVRRWQHFNKRRFTGRPTYREKRPDPSGLPRFKARWRRHSCIGKFGCFFCFCCGGWGRGTGNPRRWGGGRRRGGRGFCWKTKSYTNVLACSCLAVVPSAAETISSGGLL